MILAEIHGQVADIVEAVDTEGVSGEPRRRKEGERNEKDGKGKRRDKD